jgi:predicted O-methyltransferase YrrM
MKIAGIDNVSSKDLTQIDEGSDFAAVIRQLVTTAKPRRIIETGTYLGEGTTRAIAGALSEVGDRDVAFFSIEVNRASLQQAAMNLHARGLLDWVRLLNGLSLPRECLPSQQTIQSALVDNPEFPDIFVDHREAQRAELYYAETNFLEVEDNLLVRVLEVFDYRPDFVLLDSGGHIGTAEFDFLIPKLRAPCFIALDDIYHVKHHRNFRLMQGDSRFSILVESKEKFGFCLAHFTPSAKA